MYRLAFAEAISEVVKLIYSMWMSACILIILGDNKTLFR